MAKRKGSRTFDIMIVLMVPFLMGLLVGIIIDKKLLSKNNDNNPSNNTVVGKVEVNDKELSDTLLKMVNNNNLEKVIYNYRSNGVDFENITNDEKLYLAGIDNNYKKNGVLTTFESLKDNLINYYNTDFNVEAKDYNFHGIAVIKYNDGNYSYDGTSFTYADNSIYIDLYNAIKLEKDGDIYYLTVTGIYHQKLNDSENYSNDKGFLFNEALSKNTSIADLYKTNMEQFMKYTFEFNKINDYKYELIKFIKNN